MSRFITKLSLAFAILLLSTACTKKTADSAQSVNLAIWGNYISPEILKKFTTDTGIKVSVSNYSSNEELLAKVQMGASGFDVAVPSDYMVNVMIKSGLLEKLDKTQIPNRAEISPELLNQSYDPGNEHSLPYTWTTSGIAVNRELYKGPMNSWKDLLENPGLEGKLALLDDAREVLAAALRMKGFSANTVKPEELKAAKEVLVKTKPRVKMFTSDTIDILNNREVAAAQVYSSDALQSARASGNKIEFVLPEEGSTRAIDNLVIFKKAPHPQNALKLINFLLSADADLDRTQKILTGPVLKGTKAKLPETLQKNSSLFPPVKTLEKLESLRDLEKDNRQYEDIWTFIKSQ